ncbi:MULTISPECIES: YopT-type cysteine protease domain-containing protein [Comamonadaceae]|uniref:YopT-type cysteine protease domain-containing protein n=1 Tax=Acidovorax sacchari TaxID=3230736 RepID=UPI0034A0D781
MLAPRASLPSARPEVCSGVPPREGASAIPYRTAELTGANTEGICLGLSAEWLRRLGQSPADRMAALARGSASHAQAGQWQRQYADGKAMRRSSGTQTANADIQAQNAVLRAAGLRPADSDEVFDSNTPEVLPYVSDTIAVSGTKHLLGLYFTDGTAHTVATSASGRRTTVFDPNYGEFEARSREVESLLGSLIQRYREHGHSPVAISLQVLH